MPSNAIPTTYEPLIQRLTAALDGSSTHGAAVGLKQNDEPALRAVLHDRVGSPAGPDDTAQPLPGLKAQCNTAKANKAALTAALHSAQSIGRALALACIGTLKPRLGNKPSGVGKRLHRSPTLNTPQPSTNLIARSHTLYSLFFISHVTRSTAVAASTRACALRKACLAPACLRQVEKSLR
jgi:hypothetical protein